MNRKIQSIVLTMLAVLAMAPQISAGVITHTVTYDISKLRVGTTTLGGVTYSTVDYDGLFKWGGMGAPWLPVENLTFSVPYNATNFSVTVTAGTYDSQTIDYPILPCQVLNGRSPNLPDNDIYNLGNPYPTETAWVNDEGMMAGENHVITVTVLPLTYNTTANNGGNTYTLGLARNISLTLSYDTSDTPKVHPLVRKGASLREEGRELTRSVVVNPDDVAGNAVPLISIRGSEPNRVYPDPLDSVENPDTYMIIATQTSLRPLRRLAALKRQEGYRVKMVTIDDALEDPIAQAGDSCYQGSSLVLSFDDDAGKLRQYLRNHYLTRGTKYVLLAGTGVPFRTKEHQYADIYFSEINCDWAHYASTAYSLFVGRLLGTNSGRFDNYTDKLLRYELNPGNGDYSYLTRGLSVESPVYETYAPSDWNSAFSVTRLHQTTPPEPPINYTGSDVIDSISTNHYGIISAFHDGFPSGVKIFEYTDEHENTTVNYLWAIDTIKVAPGVYDSSTGNGLNLMNNRNYPMVYLSHLGNTMPYQTISNYGTGPNYGESFTMGKNYGGPAFLGMTGNVDNYNASTIGKRLFGRIMNSYPILSKALNDAKVGLDTDDHLDVISGLNLLGDPSMEFWTSQPQQYSGITVSRTNNSVTVSGIAEPSTIVSYHSNDGAVGTVKSTTSSVTLTGVSPNSTIMLHKHNFIPYIAPMVLQNTDLEHSQYVFATDVTAGRAVDSGRTNGGVTVKNGVEYEIEASGEVKLGGGFKVELGARFAVQRTSYK